MLLSAFSRLRDGPTYVRMDNGSPLPPPFPPPPLPRNSEPTLALSSADLALLKREEELETPSPRPPLPPPPPRSTGPTLVLSSVDLALQKQEEELKDAAAGMAFPRRYPGSYPWGEENNYR